MKEELEKIEVKIYGLYDPTTCKIRYIGRTKKTLARRVVEHIYRARHLRVDTLHKNGTHRDNWIKSLLKNNTKPKIVLLTTVLGWEESHKVEKMLIQRHCVKHNLVNADDRGPGFTGAKTIDPKVEEERIKKIKEHFNEEENKTNFYNKVYAYNLEGEYVKTFPSNKFVVEELGVTATQVTNLINSVNSGKSRKPLKGFYLSANKYEKFPFVRPLEDIRSKVVQIDEKVFTSLIELREHYSLSTWDYSQLCKLKFTTRVKKLFKGHFVKIKKNDIAVLERNF